MSVRNTQVLLRVILLLGLYFSDLPGSGPTLIDEEGEDQLIEEVVCKASDVPNGTKKEVEVHGRKLLLINDNGVFHCINGVCAHFGLPLVNGIFANGKLRCPFHSACYNVWTGDIEDYPSFDSLNVYKVRQDGDDLIVSGTEPSFSSNRRTRRIPPFVATKEAPIIVVGSGPSSQTLVENLRIAGCTSAIMMITQEAHKPYDRVRLSKRLGVDVNEIRMRTNDYYVANKIDIVNSTEVIDVDVQLHRVFLSDGSSLPYSKLVLAIGPKVRKLPNKGAELKGVHTLRFVEDSAGIAADAQDEDVVCIGASFIGMECAASLQASAKSITVICSTEEPLPAFTTDVGRSLRKFFESRGVVIFTRARLDSLEGDEEGHVKAVVLADGRRLPARCVIVGIGVDANTAWLNGKVATDDRGFIIVDEQFRTNAQDVYAIGDTVSAPLPFFNISSINIQHFQVAQRHGLMAAHCLLGQPPPGKVIPFFWSTLFSVRSVKLAGCPVGHDEIITKGDIEEWSFAQYYLKKDIVVAVVSGGGQITSAIQFLTLCDNDRRITRTDVEQNTDNNWLYLLND